MFAAVRSGGIWLGRWLFCFGLTIAVTTMVFGGVDSGAAHERQLVVFAAASLTEVLGKAAERYLRDEVVLSFAASSMLARQIAQGAPADVYVSADPLWVEHLGQYLRDGSQVVLVSNRLVWIVPSTGLSTESQRGFSPGDHPLDWLGHGYLAVGDPTHVPAGRYARAALIELGWWNDVEHRLLPAGNTRLALTYVARGEAHLGIVYRSDAQSDPRVQILAEVPSREPICYLGAVVATSTHTHAISFLDFLQTPEIQELFQQMGFVSPTSGC